MKYLIESDDERFHLRPMGNGRFEVNIEMISVGRYETVGEAERKIEAILFALDDFGLIDANVNLGDVPDT